MTSLHDIHTCYLYNGTLHTGTIHTSYNIHVTSYKPYLCYHHNNRTLNLKDVTLSYNVQTVYIVSIAT